MKYDDLPAEVAVFIAWHNTGPHPDAHYYAIKQVQKYMPLLAKALDRMAF